MQRFRGSWPALLGASLILALSLSSVLGADPADDPGSVGRSISAFAKSVAPGQNLEDAAATAEEAEQAGDDSETELEEDLDEETEEDGAHAECVSEVAESDAAGGPNENHGGAVSEAARETCPRDQDDDADPEDATASAHGECVSAVAKSDAVGGKNENHGGAVSAAARETCPRNEATEEEDLESEEGVDEVTETEEDAEEATAPGDSAFGLAGGNGKAHQAAGAQNGRGNGKGGGRP